MPSPLEPRRLGAARGGFVVRALTDDCERVFDRGEHALIGISAGNSYFSQQRIALLLDWAGRRFAAIDLLYVDLHVDAMFRASGCTRERAASRANRSVKDVRRRVRRAVESLAPDLGERVRVRALSDCTDLLGYREVARRVDLELARNPRVLGACEAHVRQVLGPQPDPDGAAMAAGLAYLRAELPFLLSTPEVLGVPSSTCCYHVPMPVLRSLRGVTSCFHPGQGHVVVQPAEEDELTGAARA